MRTLKQQFDVEVQKKVEEIAQMELTQMAQKAQTSQNDVKMKTGEETYKGKLPKVSEEESEQCNDVIYLLGRVKQLLGTYTEESILSAVERAIPGELLRRYNRENLG